MATVSQIDAAIARINGTVADGCNERATIEPRGERTLRAWADAVADGGNQLVRDGLRFAIEQDDPEPALIAVARRLKGVVIK